MAEEAGGSENDDVSFLRTVSGTGVKGGYWGSTPVYTGLGTMEFV